MNKRKFIDVFPMQPVANGNGRRLAWRCWSGTHGTSLMPAQYLARQADTEFGFRKLPHRAISNPSAFLRKVQNSELLDRSAASGCSPCCVYVASTCGIVGDTTEYFRVQNQAFIDAIPRV